MDKKGQRKPLADWGTLRTGISRRPLLFVLAVFLVMTALYVLTQLRSSLDDSFTPLTPIDQRQALAPDFTLPALTGQPIRLSDLRGQVVLLNFWATWCPPCREEMPSMEKLYQRFRSRGLEILAVSIDRVQEPVRAFMQRYHLSFPALWDAEGQVAGQYQVLGIPTTYLIDQRGFIASVEVGARDWASPGAQAMIQTLLQESK